MRQLKDRSGYTFRKLEQAAARNGDYLPRSTVADVLRRQALPRADVVAAFVRACAGEEHVAAWIRARDRLAHGTPAVTDAADSAQRHDQAPGTPAPESAPVLQPAGTSSKPRRISVLSAMILAALTAGIVVAVFTVGSWMPSDSSVDAARSAPSTAPSMTGQSKTLPAEGWYHILPAHITNQSLCLGEGRERNRRTDRPLVVQRPCAQTAPDTYLAATGVPGTYEIRWYHPVEGVGCLSVDHAETDSGALLQPASCVGAPHQRFLFEPVNHPRHGAYRLRPVHSGLCIGALGGAADIDIGAEIQQTQCTGQADQQFILRPTARAFRTSVMPPGGR